MKSDVLIIGSGLASLQLAKLLSKHLNVMILTKSHSFHSNSYLAQGGVAASISKQDDFKKHALDTLEAGRFHNNVEVVKTITKNAPDLIHELLGGGCAFDQDDNGNLLLGMEGAHSENRIVHGGGDSTGKRLVEFLTHSLGNNVTILENFFVDELIQNNQNECIGVKGTHANGQQDCFFAAHTVLATGGCGQIYSLTSSENTITGDGIALAYLAGAAVTDMEFVQFHPTLLSIEGKTVGLVSEAVRGEGARLISEKGSYIMEGVHPYKDLAPRHIVSQTIFSHIKKGEKVYLDISSIQHFEQRFPSISKMCIQNGIDLAKKKIPVAPGSHFLMGGIETDLIGRTTIKGLYAIGEAACTGFHGANRLASNSLLEGLFMGKQLAWYISTTNYLPSTFIRKETKVSHLGTPLSLPEVNVLKESMMENVGIVRKKQDLQNQLHWLKGFGIHDLSINLDTFSSKEKEIAFMLITAWLITKSALARTESRGGHYREDFPEEKEEWLKRKIVHKKEKVGHDEYNKIAKTT
ncbi:L-aspartate oxidase [Niallia sp. 01092]|uniref:L-aspartate oxidase n=1 Tax=unclassified Niallia TaxID=2837522 RepID=UPI003FCF5965